MPAITTTQAPTPSTANDSTTGALAWTGATAAGADLMAFLGINENAGDTTISSTPAGWGTAIVNNNRTGDVREYVYLIENAASRSGTETFNLAAGRDVTLHLFEFAGGVTASIIDVNNNGAATNGNSTAPASGSGTTVQNDERLLAFLVNKNADTQSAPTNSFTLLNGAHTSNGTVGRQIGSYVYVRDVTATGTYSTAATIANARPWVGVLISLKVSTTAAKHLAGTAAGGSTAAASTLHVGHHLAGTAAGGSTAAASTLHVPARVVKLPGNQLFFPRRELEDDSYADVLRRLEDYAANPLDSVALVDKLTLPPAVDYPVGSHILVAGVEYVQIGGTWQKISQGDGAVPSTPTGIIVNRQVGFFIVDMSSYARPVDWAFMLPEVRSRLQVALGGSGAWGGWTALGATSAKVAYGNLDYANEYQFRFRAADIEGNISDYDPAPTPGDDSTRPVLAPRRANEGGIVDIAAGTITSDLLVSDLILTSQITVAASGSPSSYPQIRLGPDRGFEVWTAADSGAVIRFPTDSSGIALHGSTVEADRLTVGDYFTLQGLNSILAMGSVLTAKSGVSDPSLAPSVSLDWDYVACATDPLVGPRRGLTYDPAGGAGGATASFWFSDNGVGAGECFEVKASDGTALRTLIVPGNSPQVYGITRIGASLYVLWEDTINVWTISKFNQATLALQATFTPSIPAGSVVGAISTDGTNLFIVWKNATNDVVIRKYDTAANTLGTQTTTIHSVQENPLDLTIINGYYWILMRNGTTVTAMCRVVSTSNVRDTTQDFPLQSQVRGIAYDNAAWASGVFRTISPTTNGKIYKHTDLFTGANDFYGNGVFYSWIDNTTPTKESGASPTAAVTSSSYRRGTLVITVPALPSTVVGFRAYLHWFDGFSLGNLRLTPTPLAAGISQRVIALVGTSGFPQTATPFPTGTPAYLDMRAGQLAIPTAGPPAPVEGHVYADPTTHLPVAYYNSKWMVLANQLPFNFTSLDLPISVTDQALQNGSVFSGPASRNMGFTMVRAGSVVGISLSSNQAKTAGTATFKVWKNGVLLDAACVLAWGNNDHDSVLFAPGLYNFAAGDVLSFVVTTNAGLLPAGTADLVVTLFVLQTL